jgi:hypothetical protein
MSTSALATLLDALYDGLSIRAGLSGIGVASSYRGAEWLGEQTHGYIMFYEGSFTQEPLGMGETDRMETFQFRGEITAIEPGAGQTAAMAACTSAVAILAELETFADDFTLGGVALEYELSSGEFSSGIWLGPSGGQFFEIQFLLTLKTHIVP